METISISTRTRTEFVEISSKVAEIVRKSKVKEGICVVFCPHTTAGLTINENADPDVQADILNSLNKLVPHNGNYSHVEGNADAHIKASLMGSSLNILIKNGGLVLGTWQGVFLTEFDGPRERKVYVEVAGK
jgi:secondary thiamine-phosphate synthase enzyme